MMKNFRENPPRQLGGSDVVLVKDYADLNARNLKTGAVEKLDMPTTSNVLQYFTEDGTKVSVRPSGTEPKIKFYIEVKGTLASEAEYDATVAAADNKIAAVKADLGI